MLLGPADQEVYLVEFRCRCAVIVARGQVIRRTRGFDDGRGVDDTRERVEVDVGRRIDIEAAIDIRYVLFDVVKI